MAQRNYYDNEDVVDKVGNYILKHPKRIILGGLALFLLGMGTCQSIYTIPQDSKGVIRRFGKYNQITEPGINIKIPFGIDEVDVVPVQKIQRAELGFRTIEDGTYIGMADLTHTDLISKSELEQLTEEYRTLTGDLNIVDIEWVVQYKIRDPQAYLFNIKDPIDALREGSLATMKKIVGDGSVDEAITIGRTENEIKAKTELQTILDNYHSGIQVIAVQLQSSHPPERVRSSFNEVNKSMAEKEQKINNAMQEYNKVIPKAIGEADKLIKEAMAYKIERINEANGDVARFLKILEEYKSAPAITRTRLYLETMEEILPQIEEKYIIEQKGAEGGILQKLDLNSEVKK